MHALIDFKVMGDHRGSLVAIENNDQIPFDVKRIFYVYNTSENVPRGCHANRKSKFVLISIHGSCKIKIRGQQGDTEIELNDPSQGLWLDKMVWKEMFDFSADSVLLILSNEFYDKDEYIYNFSQYLEEIQSL